LFSRIRAVNQLSCLTTRVWLKKLIMLIYLANKSSSSSSSSSSLALIIKQAKVKHNNIFVNKFMIMQLDLCM